MGARRHSVPPSRTRLPGLGFGVAVLAALVLGGAFGALAPSSGSASAGPVPSQVAVRPLASPLNLSATAAPLRGDAPLRVAFNGTASGGAPPYRFTWLFGDGTASPLANTTHAYGAQGTYTATLFANDSLNASASRSLSITVAPTLSVVASAGPLRGPAPLTVSFNAVVSGGIPPDSVAWHFGDGGAEYRPSSQHTYRDPGAWTAMFTVWDAVSSLATASVPVTVTAPLAAQASAGVLNFTCTNAGLLAYATLSGSANGGAPPYRYAWAFGDGSTQSGASSATHAFAAGRVYVSAFTVSDASGANVSRTVDVITTGSSLPCATPQAVPPWETPVALVAAGGAAVATVTVVAWSLKRRA
jgi:PKD repeat protein